MATNEKLTVEVKVDGEELKTLIKEVIKETGVGIVESYEYMVSAYDDPEEGMHYEVRYKGKKINDVTKIVRDTRINEE